MYAPQIGRMVDVRIPIVPMSHQYLITDNFIDADAIPAAARSDNLIYFRQEVSGLLMGGYERTKGVERRLQQLRRYSCQL